MKKRSRNSQNGSSSKSPKGTRKRAKLLADKSIKAQRPIDLDETEEEREKRLAKRMALTLRAFRMAYDDHHRS
jgi:hypothetical protein